jgi:DNA polymerase-3 subunit gamma/tau
MITGNNGGGNGGGSNSGGDSRATSANQVAGQTADQTTGSTASAPPPQSGGSGRHGSAATAVAPSYDARQETVTEQPPLGLPLPQTFEEVLALADKNREAMLRTHLVSDVRIVHFEVGRIEFNPGPGAPRDLAGRLAGFLNGNTDIRWMVSVSSETGEQTLQEKQQSENDALRAEAQSLPLVRAVLDTFPGAKLEEVRKTRTAELPALANPEPQEDE